MRTVAEVARKDLGTVRPDDTVTRARSEMDRTGSDQLPVSRSGSLEGVVTRDALGSVTDPAGTGVASYVVPAPALPASTPLDEAAAALDRSGLSWLPVVEGDRLVGAVGSLELGPALRSQADDDDTETRLATEPISYATGAAPVSDPVPDDDRGSASRVRALGLVVVGGLLVLAVLLVIAISVL